MLYPFYTVWCSSYTCLISACALVTHHFITCNLPGIFRWWRWHKYCLNPIIAHLKDSRRLWRKIGCHLVTSFQSEGNILSLIFPMLLLYSYNFWTQCIKYAKITHVHCCTLTGHTLNSILCALVHVDVLSIYCPHLHLHL